MTSQVNRRFFVKLSAVGLAVVSLGNLLTGRPVQAQARSGRGGGETPKVEMDDPQAKALGYQEDAKLSPIRKSPDQFCQTCLLYSGQEGAQWGPCAIFSYRMNKEGQPLVVSANGWCRSWGPRAA